MSLPSLSIGPRGLRGVIGWTFFDPANLIAVTLLALAAGLCVYAMQSRDASDWYMPLGLYLCLAAFLRGYFFQYYHGGRLSRVVVLLVLLFGLIASALLWEDRASAYRMREGEHFVRIEGAPPFHWAALLHGVTAVTLLIHSLLPRRWLIRATDEVAEVAHLDHTRDTEMNQAPDAAPEVASDGPSKKKATGA